MSQELENWLQLALGIFPQIGWNDIIPYMLGAVIAGTLFAFIFYRRE